jgi:hypothetical protein
MLRPNWIPMRVDLGRDLKVIRVARALRVSEFAVVGMLHSLWSWADGATMDGNLPHVSGQWIDKNVAVPGFTAALMDPAVNWLQITDNGSVIPNYDVWLSRSAKRRMREAKRKQDGK